MSTTSPRTLRELIARLQRAGYPVSTAETLDATRLLTKLAEREPSPSSHPFRSFPSSSLGTPSGKLQLPDTQGETTQESPVSDNTDANQGEFLLQHLRPLLCKSADPAVQQRFDKIFHDWWQPGIAAAKKPPKASDQKVPRREPPKITQPRRHIVLLSLMLLALVLIYWLQPTPQNWKTNTTTPIDTGAESVAPQPITPAPIAPAPTPNTRIYGYWPAYRYTETLRSGLAWLLVGAPLSLLLFFHLPAWALGRRRGSGGAGIVLDGWDHDKAARHLVPPLAAAVADCFDRHIRGPAHEIRRLARRPPIDIIRTVDATLNHIGIPQLRYRHARLRPDYLLLVEADSDEALPMLWAERLQKQGVAVDLRQLIVPKDGGVPTWRTRHGGASGRFDRLPNPGYGQRLMLVSDGSFLLDEAAQWRPWVSAARLERWPVRALFSPKEPRDLLRGRLATLDSGIRRGDPGFLVLPQEESALAAWSTWLASGQMPVIVPAEAQRFPRLIAERGEQRYLTELADFPEGQAPGAAEVARLIAELHVYLGENGFYWLCCCAIPPLMHSGLTLLLGEEYLRRAGAGNEKNLRYHLTRNYRLLARLPWLRYNSMPDWLRLALLARLSEPLQQEVRTVVDGLLSRQKPARVGNLHLAFDAPGAGVGPGAVSGPRGTRHALYLGFMSGLSARELLLRTPGQWRSWLSRLDRGRHSWRRLCDWLAAGFARLLFRDGLAGNGAARFSLLAGWVATISSGVLLVAVALFSPGEWPEAWREALFVERAEPLVFRQDGLIHGLAFSADGRRLAVAGSNEVRQWNLQSGAPQGRVQAPEEFPAAIRQHLSQGMDPVLSPDGKLRLASPDAKTIQLVDVVTGQAIGELLRHEAPVIYAVFSPDGRHIATADAEGHVRLWNAQVSVPLGEPMRHDDLIRSVTYRLDGRRLVTASDDGSARLWDARSGAPQGEPLWHRQKLSVWHAAFSPDGHKLVTAGVDAMLWDADSGAALAKPLRHEAGHIVLDAAFSPDGRRVATASSDHTARLWDAHTGQPLGEPLRHDGQLWHVEFSPDSRWLATASWDNTARLWDTQTGQPLGVPMRHELMLWQAAFSPDGTRLATASSDNTARLWDAQTGQPLTAPLPHDGPVLQVNFNPDGRRLVTASADKTARQWDAHTGAALGPPMHHEAALRQAVYSPDGLRILTAGEDATARLWDSRTGAPLGVLPAVGQVWAAAFHPNGRQVLLAGAAGKEGEARLWRIPPYPESPPAFQFSAAVRQTTALALPLLALLLGLAGLVRQRRRLRCRLERLAPPRKTQVHYAYVNASLEVTAAMTMHSDGIQITRPPQ
ncbi:MAG: hypothetical protein EPN21_18370 [Methylococcaceae bacterium]|nr:MAG: hypothetical protein EPN21_18370 [Methylococcaceae bacterium]